MANTDIGSFKILKYIWDCLLSDHSIHRWDFMKNIEIDYLVGDSRTLVKKKFGINMNEGSQGNAAGSEG